jgi:hypothetical protein
VLVLALAIACLHLPAAPAAQGGSGSVRGRVITREGAAIPGATITLAQADVRRSVVTRVDGRFLVEGLPPGTYQLRGETAGFRTALIENVNVTSNGTVDATVVMQLGILQHVDYVLPENGLRGALESADLVAHIRITGQLETSLLGRDRNVLATEHAATVVQMVKGPGLSPGAAIRFWQDSAGRWSENGRVITGTETPYAPGQELIAFLKDDGQGGLGEVAGRHLMLIVRDGSVSVQGRDGRLSRQMTVADLLASLRNML